jgi:transposase-like protein
MSAEADAGCRAGYGERSDERTNVRNGYRHRDFDSRAGTLDVERLAGRVEPDGAERGLIETAQTKP